MRINWFAIPLVLGIGVASAEKYHWEPYPWPSYAGKPSREKAMRRDFGQPLEFGEIESTPSSKRRKITIHKQKSLPLPKKKQVIELPTHNQFTIEPEKAPRPPLTWYKALKIVWRLVWNLL